MTDGPRRVVSIRLGPDESRDVARAAKSEGLAPTTWMRLRVVAAARRVLKRKEKNK